MKAASSMPSFWASSCIGLYAIGVAVSQSLMSLGGTLLCLWILVFIARDARQLLSNQYLGITSILCYCTWAGFQLVVSENPHFEQRAWSQLPLFLVPFLCFFASSKREDNRFWISSFSWRKVLLVWLIAFAISCFYAIYQGLFLGQMATGWLRNPIYFAYNVLFQIVCFATFFRHSDDRSLQKGLLTAIFLGIVAIFFSNSRMVMLCSILILGIMILPSIWRRGRSVVPGGRASLLVAMLLIGGTAGYEYQNKPYVRERVHNALNFQSESWKGRLRAWQHNKSLIRENTLTGVGMLQNGMYTKELSDPWQKLWGPDVVIYAHNIYLQLLAESGMIGLLLFLTSLILFFRKYPLSIWLLGTLALSGLTENSLSNSKSLHSFLFCLFFVGLSSQLGELRKKS